jgi:hypothetical protein
MDESDFPLPPPTFEFLIFSVKTQAEMRLGVISMGENRGAPDLSAARHAIDMLAMLSEKTRGNLSFEEQRLMENSLTELRFRYVQVSEAVLKAKAAAASAPEEPADMTKPGTPQADSPQTDTPQADTPKE